jgi:hypothetical protein
VALAALGLGAAAYGVLRLLRLPPDQVVAVLVWVAGGILGHDGLLAPLVVVLGVAAVPLLPDWLRTPVIRALIVVGPLTLVAVPVLGRFGAKPDNPTLLDRPYLLGYGSILLVGLAVTAASALRARRLAAGDPPPGPSS